VSQWEATESAVRCKAGGLRDVKSTEAARDDVVDLSGAIQDVGAAVLEPCGLAIRAR